MTSDHDEQAMEEKRPRSDLEFALDLARSNGRLPERTPELLPPLDHVETRPVEEVDEEDEDEQVEVPAGSPPRSGSWWYLADRPRRQTQEVVAVDLRDGVVACVGGLGSGKTSALATLAWSFSADHPAALVYALDAGGGDLIRLIEGTHPSRRPDTGPLVPHALWTTSDSVVDTTLLIDRLEAMVIDGGSQVAQGPVLLLIDNIVEVQNMLARYRALPWLDRLATVMTRGRSRGVHVGFTAGRLTEVDISLRSSVKSLITLGLGAGADENAVSASPGRGRDKYGDEIHVLSPFSAPGSPKPPPSRLTERFTNLAYPLTARDRGDSHLDENDITIPIGRDVSAKQEVTATLGSRHLMVVGPPRSGKSHVASVIASSVADRTGRRLMLLSGKPANPPPWASPIDIDRVTSAGQQFSSPDLATSMRFFHAALEGHLENGSALLGGRPVLVVDDAHLLRRDKEVIRLVEFVIERDLMPVVLTSDVGATSQYDWKTLKDHSGQVLFLRPSVTSDVNDGARVIGDELRPRPGTTFAAGAGLLYDHRVQIQLQVYWNSE